MQSRPFEKKLTSIGGSEGIIIPSNVLYAIDVKRGDKIRVWIEKIDDKKESADGITPSAKRPLSASDWRTTSFEAEIVEIKTEKSK